MCACGSTRRRKRNLANAEGRRHRRGRPELTATMACGEFGPGRMAEPHEIVAAIEGAARIRTRVLTGLKALVTAGPTHEPIDPVRFIANRSSGKQGYAIAAALADAGAETVLVSGPSELAPPSRAKLVRVETAREMLAACEAALPADVAVCARPSPTGAPRSPRIEDQEARSRRATIKLTENPDILADARAAHASRPALVIGFAAETDDAGRERHGQARRARAATGSSPTTCSTGDHGRRQEPRAHRSPRSGSEDWPEMTKGEVARAAGRAHRRHSRKARGMKVEVQTSAACARSAAARLRHGGIGGPRSRWRRSTARSCCRPGARMACRPASPSHCPQGLEAQVRPRSGLALKHGVTC